MALKVTLVPLQMVVLVLAEMLTDGVTVVVNTDMVTLLEFAVADVTQLALELSIQVIRSLLLKVLPE